MLSEEKVLAILNGYKDELKSLENIITNSSESEGLYEYREKLKSKIHLLNRILEIKEVKPIVRLKETKEWVK